RRLVSMTKPERNICTNANNNSTRASANAPLIKRRRLCSLQLLRGTGINPPAETVARSRRRFPEVRDRIERLIAAVHAARKYQSAYFVDRSAPHRPAHLRHFRPK